MKTGPAVLRLLTPASAVIVLLLAAGCGYSIQRHADLPYKEIAIGVIENRTLQPKLEDKLHNALVEEFLRQGITVNRNSPSKLTAVINNFEMSSLSEKEEVTIQYRVLVNADFRLVDKDGKELEIKNINSPFIVSFAGSEDLGKLLAARETAEDKALKDVASEVAGALIYK